MSSTSLGLGGRSLAIFVGAVSGVIVATYSAILSLTNAFKQTGHRQSAFSSGGMIAGNSVHQHWESGASASHPKLAAQTEQTLLDIQYDFIASGRASSVSPLRSEFSPV
jgi:hypothetical protein